MGKNKPKRVMTPVGQSQQVTEQANRDKFAATQHLANPVKTVTPTQAGRISPQLSCTIAPEDMEFLQQLTLELSVKAGKALKLSQTVRSLIAYGKLHKNNLTVIE